MQMKLIVSKLKKHSFWWIPLLGIVISFILFNYNIVDVAAFENKMDTLSDAAGTIAGLLIAVQTLIITINTDTNYFAKHFMRSPHMLIFSRCNSMGVVVSVVDVIVYAFFDSFTWCGCFFVALLLCMLESTYYLYKISKNIYKYQKFSSE